MKNWFCKIARSGLRLVLLIGLGLWTFNLLANEDEVEAIGYVDYYKKPFVENELYAFKSRINYEPLAQSITQDCIDDYQKIMAIYQWICANIDYDTSFKIKTADACYKAKKGVCQAYCELFYHLATSVGVNVEIVCGKARGYANVGPDAGHAWIFAYTRENQGILLDPTWGAGGVNGKEFVRRVNPWIWFNVIPERMVLSHFPEEKSYQLIKKPLSVKEFFSMPVPNDLWFEYGLDPYELLQKARKNNLDLPDFFNKGEGKIQLAEIPMSHSLKIGQFYTFRIKMTCSGDFALMNNSVLCRTEEWDEEGDSVFSVQFMPRETGTLSLSLKSEDDNAWRTIVKYQIEPPTSQDWKNVEKHYPLSVPEVKAVGNLDVNGWEQAGVDEKNLLSLICEKGVKELPVIHSERGQKLRVVSVPMTKQLKKGTTYSFQFYPLSNKQWMLINNDTWFEDWTIADDGMYSISIVPSSVGRLSLFVQSDDGESFWQCIEYEVAE